MLLFDCFLSPELLLVKILAAALVGTFRELPIGSKELRLARAETLSNDVLGVWSAMLSLLAQHIKGDGKSFSDITDPI